MKRYNSIMEILKSKDLSLIEIQERMEEYIAEKGMTLEEFCETEEGQEMVKFNEQRFWKPM